MRMQFSRSESCISVKIYLLPKQKKSDIEPQFLLGGRGCERSKLSSVYQNWLQRLYITRFCIIIIVTIEP